MKKQVIMMVLGLSLFSGCGTSSHQDLSTVQVPYEINNYEAEFTPANITKLAKKIVATKNNRVVARTVDTTPSQLNINKLLTSIMINTKNKQKSAKKSTKSIDYGYCQNYGTLRVDNSGGNSHQNTILTFDECLYGGVQIDGVIEVDTFGYDLEYTDFDIDSMDMYFDTNIYITYQGIQTTLHRGGKLQLTNLVYDYYDSANIVKMNLTSSYFATSQGEVTGEYLLHSVYEKLSSSRLRQSIYSGKFYIQEGYFQVQNTQNAFLYDGDVLLAGGSLTFIGKNSQKALLEATGYNEITLSIDQDGDDVYEYNEVINL